MKKSHLVILWRKSLTVETVLWTQTQIGNFIKCDRKAIHEWHLSACRMKLTCGCYQQYTNIPYHRHVRTFFLSLSFFASLLIQEFRHVSSQFCVKVLCYIYYKTHPIITVQMATDFLRWLLFLLSISAIASVVFVGSVESQERRYCYITFGATVAFNIYIISLFLSCFKVVCNQMCFTTFSNKLDVKMSDNEIRNYKWMQNFHFSVYFLDYLLRFSSSTLKYNVSQ